MSLLSVIQSETTLNFRPSNGDGVYRGACPFCADGEDRFVIFGNQPKPRYHCRVCSKAGDAIQFLREFSNLSYVDAAKRVDEIGGDSFFSIRVVNPKQKRSVATPSNKLIATTSPYIKDGDTHGYEAWHEACATLAFESQERLHSSQGQKALAWLTETRKLSILYFAVNHE